MYAKLLKIPNSVLISRVGTIFIKWLCKCLSYTLPNKSTFNLRSHVQSSPLSEWWSCISDLIVPTLTFVPVASPVTPFTRVLHPPITCRLSSVLGLSNVYYLTLGMRFQLRGMQGFCTDSECFGECKYLTYLVYTIFW